jgi:hypothetical protein
MKIKVDEVLAKDTVGPVASCDLMRQRRATRFSIYQRLVSFPKNSRPIDDAKNNPKKFRADDPFSHSFPRYLLRGDKR